MGSGTKGKNNIDMGNYVGSTVEKEAYEWCINNGIFISPKAKNTTEWFLDIIINGKTSTSPNAYKKIDIWKQLYKFYTYYYDKYANKIEVKTVEDPKNKQKQQKVEPNINNLKLF